MATQATAPQRADTTLGATGTPNARSLSSPTPLNTIIYLRAANQPSGLGMDLVNMSATICHDRTYVTAKASRSYCSCSQATDTRCVRDKCRIVGFLPVLRIDSIAWLSPHTSTDLIPRTPPLNLLEAGSEDVESRCPSQQSQTPGSSETHTPVS